MDYLKTRPEQSLAEVQQFPAVSWWLGQSVSGQIKRSATHVITDLLAKKQEAERLVTNVASA